MMLEKTFDYFYNSTFNKIGSNLKTRHLVKCVACVMKHKLSFFTVFVIVKSTTIVKMCYKQLSQFFKLEMLYY